MSLRLWRAPGSCLLLALLAVTGACGGESGPQDVEVSLSDTELLFEAVGETQQLTATVTEAGQPVTSPDLDWSTSDQSVATVSSTGVVTAAGQGSAEISARYGDGEAIADVTVNQIVVALTRQSGNGQCGDAGQPLARPFVVLVEDAEGSPVPGVVVEFSVTEGTGTVSPSQATSDDDGTAAAVLTLGPLAGGTYEVTAVTADDISTTFSAAIAGAPVAVRAFAGNGESAETGEAVAPRPAVQVVDANDCPIPGVQARFAAPSGDGSITGGIQTTNEEGVATVGDWVLGSEPVNTMSATVDGLALEGEPVLFVATTPPSTGYDIRVKYLGTYSGDQLLAFAQAETRWETLITGDLPDVNDDLPGNQCGGNPATEGPFDDLTIFVTIEEIDGPGSVLGQAGPCFIRVPGDLTVIGRMQFDVEDIELLESEGALQAVILHEMGHVLGFGTLWEELELVEDVSEPDPDPPLADTHFIGAKALLAFDAAGGTSYSGAKVPVQNDGGAGTVNSHWRDNVFDPELMTGFLNNGFNPLSAVTVASLEDLGYTVNPGGADPFTLDPGFRIAGPRLGRLMVNDVIRDPIRRVDASGRIVGLYRP